SFLVFALLMSLLPWVEIRCETTEALGPFNKYALVTQNAWQAMLGDTTGRPPPNLDSGGAADRQKKALPKEGKADVEPAPLVGVFLAFALAGAVLGFTVPARKTRLVLMAVLCVGALGALVTQTALGFPLKKKDRADILNYLQEVAPEHPELRGPRF